MVFPMFWVSAISYGFSLFIQIQENHPSNRVPNPQREALFGRARRESLAAAVSDSESVPIAPAQAAGEEKEGDSAAARETEAAFALLAEQPLIDAVHPERVTAR